MARIGSFWPGAGVGSRQLSTQSDRLRQAEVGPEAAGRHHSFVAVSGQAFIASAAEREVDRHGERRRPSAGLFVGVSAVSINLRAPT